MNISFDELVRYLIIGIGVLSAISSFVGGAQKKRNENEKLETELRQLEEKRREANPDTQSYTTYLERTRAETLNNDSAPDALGHSKRQPHVDLPKKTGSFLDDFQVAGQGNNPKPQSEQDRLREEMARKMGRPVTQTTQPTPQPKTPPVLGPFEAFEQMLRELEKKTNPAPPPPPQQKRRQKPRPAPQAQLQPAPQTPTPQANVPKPSAPPPTTTTQPTSALWSVAPDDMVRAIVMSEILGAPKAKRR